MLSHSVLSVTLFSAVAAIVGCQSMSPVKTPVDAGGATVEVRLNPARTLDVRDQAGAHTSLEGVSVARGQIPIVSGDSVIFRIDSWRGGSPVGDHDLTGAQTVFSASDPDLTFLRDRFSAKKNLLAAAILVGLVSLGIGQASVGGY